MTADGGLRCTPTLSFEFTKGEGCATQGLKFIANYGRVNRIVTGAGDFDVSEIPEMWQGGGEEQERTSFSFPLSLFPRFVFRFAALRRVVPIYVISFPFSHGAVILTF